jgi:hypothetical protein
MKETPTMLRELVRRLPRWKSSGIQAGPNGKDADFKMLPKVLDDAADLIDAHRAVVASARLVVERYYTENSDHLIINSLRAALAAVDETEKS